MTFKGRDYLVAVDWYSKYPDIALTDGMMAPCIINHLKSMFARLGIAEELLSDNMPFASKEFVDFTTELLLSDLWDQTGGTNCLNDYENRHH